MDVSRRLRFPHRCKPTPPRRSRRLTLGLSLVAAVALGGCDTTAADAWTLALAHTEEGVPLDGSLDALVGAIRRGCPVRVAWGTRRRADPGRTIEHASDPVWLSVPDGASVTAQLGDVLINLPVVGEPEEDHPARAPFGGTARAVFWRANLSTDGTFDAIWYDRGTGELINRVPQRHRMRWYVQCAPGEGEPLFDQEQSAGP